MGIGTGMTSENTHFCWIFITQKLNIYNTRLTFRFRRLGCCVRPLGSDLSNARGWHLASPRNAVSRVFVQVYPLEIYMVTVDSPKPLWLWAIKCFESHNVIEHLVTSKVPLSVSESPPSLCHHFAISIRPNVVKRDITTHKPRPFQFLIRNIIVVVCLVIVQRYRVMCNAFNLRAWLLKPVEKHSTLWGCVSCLYVESERQFVQCFGRALGKGLHPKYSRLEDVGGPTIWSLLWFPKWSHEKSKLVRFFKSVRFF